MLLSLKAPKLSSSKAHMLQSSQALKLRCSQALKFQSSQALKIQRYIKIKTCTDYGVAHAPPLTSSLSAAIELLLLVLLPSSSSHRRHRCCTVQKSFTRARTPMPPGRGLASFRAATRNLPMLKRPLAAAHIMRGVAAAWPIFPFFKRSIYYYILYTIPCTSAK